MYTVYLAVTALIVAGVHIVFFDGPVLPTCFLVGAFTVHLANRKGSGNEQPGNAGPVFYADILGPTAL